MLFVPGLVIVGSIKTLNAEPGPVGPVEPVFDEVPGGP